MADYAQTSLDAATTALALRLSDSAFVRFLQDELDLYIIEALRTWNALTGTAYDICTGTASAGSAFLDKPTVFSTQRAYTVTDQQLVAIISYHLYEPKSTSAWVGSEMFTLADITQALQWRRDQFLLETGCVVTHTAPYPAAPVIINRSADGQVDLSTSVIDVLRLAWQDAENGKITPLWLSSHAALRGRSSTWNLSPDLPRTYTYDKRGPITIQLAPPNNAGGTLDMLTVNSGAVLNPAAGVVLGVPDDFTPFIKWGALADLFGKDGPAQDYPRSLFCERMYQRGVSIARRGDPVIEARLGNRVLQPSSIDKLDASVQYWQNKTGTPQVIADAGLNMFALYPVPDADYGLEFNMIRNMPVPDQANRTTSYLQVGREYLGIILGYAQHLAMLKVGGQEFAATTHFAEMFFKAAQTYPDRAGVAGLFSEDDLQMDTWATPQQGDMQRADATSSGQQQDASAPIPPATGVDRQTGKTLR